MIHIIAPFVSGNGGDWHAIDLFVQYSKTHQVMLWSQQPPLDALKTKYPIQEIKPYSGQVPNKGILIISGARTEIGHWIKQSSFNQIIMLHNLLSPGILYRALKSLQKNSKNNIEIVYVSDLVKQFSGLPGRTVYHAPPPERFQPKTRNADTNRTFTVGRTSTDILAKHHYSDIKVYKALANEGINIRITGGTCLIPWLEDYRSISLLPVVNQSQLVDTYNEMDCFYYRVPSTVKDPFPIVVMEAMLSGLPVVCHRDVGSIEVIKHGVNGFIFDTYKEAIEIIKTLKNNANLCKEIGMQAVQSCNAKETNTES
ncbi:MAG TPA: glycosyltransferase family 4 protein [Methylotenera sp.]|nr:glycosyltransferase family 4 protein [Methylotenera sp.]